jgi:predicted AAA+ superfamily ATPase
MISRVLEAEINNKLFQGKAVVLIGPRQTGKTTLIKKIIALRKEKSLFLNCDDPVIRENLSNVSLFSLRQIVSDNKIIFIDEAQRVKNIGITLKLIHDNLDVQLVVSGSSALEITDEVNEPLTGRKWEYKLLPVSWQELNDHFEYLGALGQLETRLIYGMYPDVINYVGNEREVINELTSSYLYKDLLQFEGVRKPEIIEKILKALAFQLGSEVSYNELSQLIQVDKNTLSKYIDLLEKVFIVFRLPSFRRNMRNEIGTKKKIYFHDNGVRNAILGNFNSLSSRTDIGVLWENFLISEIFKKNLYARGFSKHYFWRTISQQEIDLIVENDAIINAFEMKWNINKKVKVPSSFLKNYPEANFHVINKNNFTQYLL